MSSSPTSSALRDAWNPLLSEALLLLTPNEVEYIGNTTAVFWRRDELRRERSSSTSATTITQTTSPTTTIAAMITGVESPPPPPPLCADAVELTDVVDVEPFDVEPFVPPVGDDDRV